MLIANFPAFIACCDRHASGNTLLLWRDNSEPAIEIDGILSPGNRFGPYVIEALLGRGGMGEVYAARLDSDQVFALKLIGREILEDDAARKLFKVETRESLTLQHSHIVHVEDHGEQDGQPYLRMELMPGIQLPGGARALSLEDYLKARGGQLSEANAWPILRDVLIALSYAHSEGVIHRDIKPASSQPPAFRDEFCETSGLEHLVHSRAGRLIHGWKNRLAATRLCCD